MPPLIIEPHDVDRAIAILEVAIKQAAPLGNQYRRSVPEAGT
jgi:hypothetical protein